MGQSSASQTKGASVSVLIGILITFLVIIIGIISLLKYLAVF